MKELNKIIEILKKNLKVESILLVGSFLKTDKPNDIDLLIVMDEYDIKFNEIIELFKTNNYLVEKCDDSIRIGLNPEINIAIFTKFVMDNRLSSIFNFNIFYGENRIWSLGYWLPEALLIDIYRGQILFEKNSYISNYKNLFSEKYSTIKGKIIDECNKEIILKTGMLKKEKDFLVLNLIKRDLILCFIRLEIIKNENEKMYTFKDFFKEQTPLKQKLEIIENTKSKEQLINLIENISNT